MSSSQTVAYGAWAAAKEGHGADLLVGQTRGMIMNTKILGIVGITAALTLVAAPIQGQRGPRAEGPGMRSGVAERALSLREHLELDDGQIAALDQMRQEALAERQAAMSEMLRTRSEVAAGALTRADARERIETARSATGTDIEARQEQLAEILSDQRLEQFREAQQRGRRSEARMRGGRRGGDMGPRGGQRFRRGRGVS